MYSREKIARHKHAGLDVTVFLGLHFHVTQSRNMMPVYRRLGIGEVS
jgi:hypothetical protein